MSEPTDTPPPQTVNMVSPHGETYAVPLDQVDAARMQQFRPETEADQAARVAKQVNEERYGGVGGAIRATVAGGANAITFGGLAALADDDWKRDLRGLREAHPIPSLVGEVGGTVAAALATGGGSLAATPAGVAARTGRAITALGEGASTVGRLGTAAAGAAAEGALFGLGSGITELALSEDPVSWERATSTLSSHALFGFGVGAAAGTLAKGAELGLGKARTALAEHAATREVAEKLPADLVSLDARGLRIAYEAELEAIEAQRVLDRRAVAGDIGAHRKEVYETSRIWQATKDAADPEIRTVAKQAANADKQLRNLLDNPKYLAENPQAAKAALQKQEHAFEQLVAARPRLLKELGEGIPTAADDVAEGVETVVSAKALRARGYTEAAGVGDDAVKLEKARRAIAEGQRDAIDATVSPGGRIEIGDGRHRLAAAVEAGSDIKVRWSRGVASMDTPEALAGVVTRGGEKAGEIGARISALDAVPAALERNRALQARIAALTAKPSSARLTSIDDARTALGELAARPKSLGEQLTQGLVFGKATAATAAVGTMIGGPVGALVGAAAPFVGAKASKIITEKVFGRVAGASAEASKRQTAAIDSFFAATARGVKVAPPVATKVLTAVRYAPPSRREEPAAPASSPRPPRGTEQLAHEYTRVAGELRSQTMIGPAGTPVMRQEARAALADTLSPIAAFAPLLADRMETIAVRRIEYLAGKLIPHPDLAMPLGTDRWQAHDMKMREFARAVAAVEDPLGVVERLAHGTVTPEDAEAMRAVYPEMMAEITMQIVERLPTLRATLPFHRRLALSIFSGVPVDPAMEPGVLSTLQSQFEYGDEGPPGPRATPQFGSVRKSAPEPTPAQSRAA